MKFVHPTVQGGDNVSPGFTWADPPPDTKSFAFSIVDPHPVARNWVHWLFINIPFRERKVVEGSSRTGEMPQGSLELYNSYRALGYGGPAPPRGSGPHPYVATLYALNVESLTVRRDATLNEFLRAIEGKIIDQATMKGYFEQE